MFLTEIILLLSLMTISYSAEIDPNGYIVYCPCMGRFGNQADQFLGALGFSKGINRTLILPPWVEYRYGEPHSLQVPFDTYFEIEPLQEYHPVITMEQFMKELAPIIWPPEKRISFCYVARGSSNNCNAKEGNPFGPFWNTFNIDFIGSEFYEPLHYDTYNYDMAKKWTDKYKSEDWPVLAFTGAPGSFPVQLENRPLHKYLKWNEDVITKAKIFIKNNLSKGAFIGIHLRNGVDWIRACEHIQHSPNLFSASQCLGYRNENGKATYEMCLPTKEIIVKQLKRIIKKMKDIKSVFVASDNNYMLTELSDSLKRTGVEIYKMEPANPHVELAILGLSNHFIGNCISSFSAFVKRERDVAKLPSSFWAFPAEKTLHSKEEL